MKILSFNVRGLGDKAKWRVISSLVINKEVDFLAIQETKKRDVKGMLCSTLFGSGHLGWVHKPAVN